MNWRLYWQLGRLDKPVGTALLWCPTAWALWVANLGKPPLKLIFLFFAGTILMRTAGCVINDIADRNIDLHVKRTKERPLTAGKISLVQAFVFFCTLLFCAAIIVLHLPKDCFLYAVLALLITGIYPFCKRFFSAPQCVLGLAFSMGIPMAYVASAIPINTTVLLLLIINFLWTLAYDTQYAMIDRPDDVKIGIRSTAILFAQYDRLVIAVLQSVFHGLWLIIAANYHKKYLFFIFWMIAGIILVYQQFLLNRQAEDDYLKAFKSNVFYGMVMWLAIS